MAGQRITGESYLVHLKGRQDSFDQDCGADRAPRNAQRVLGKVEDVVPEPGLQVRLHLGQVEVGPVAIGDELLGVVEEVQAEIQKTRRDGRAIHHEMLVVQMPSSGAFRRPSSGRLVSSSTAQKGRDAYRTMRAGRGRSVLSL